MSVLIARRDTTFRPLLPPTYQRVEYLYRTDEFEGPYADISGITLVAGDTVQTWSKLVSNPDKKEMGFGFCAVESHAIELYYQASSGNLSLWFRPSGAITNSTIVVGDVDTITFTAQQSLPLVTFGLYRAGAYYANVRLYGLRITGSNAAVKHDFIPCRRNADGVLGFYDRITDTFFPNAAGSGTWVAGADVHE